MTMSNDILKIEEHLKERVPQDVLDSVARISQSNKPLTEGWKMPEVTRIDVAIDNIGDAIREVVRMGDTAALEEELRGVLEFLHRLKEFARDKRELEEFLR